MALTKKDIESKIATVQVSKMGKKTTVVLVMLENGFEVVGTSACVDSADFDIDSGKQIAMKNAIDKIGQLEGYLAQERRSHAKPLV